MRTYEHLHDARAREHDVLKERPSLAWTLVGTHELTSITCRHTAMQQPDETWIDATGSESQDHIALYDVRPGKMPNHLYRVALERLGGRQFFEQLELPEDSQLKIHALRRWHKDKLGPVQRIASYMLCKQFYIGMSQLKVWALGSPLGPYTDLRNSQLQPSWNRPTTRHIPTYCSGMNSLLEPSASRLRLQKMVFTPSN